MTPPPHTHTQTNTSHRYDSPGQGFGPSQRPLPDNTQDSQQTSVHPAAFESTVPASERPQTNAADSAATEIGQLSVCDPQKAIEARRKGKLILYSRSDLSKSYLYWQYMNIDIPCTHRRESSKVVCTCNKDGLPINIQTP